MNTYQEYCEDMLESLNRQNGVIGSVDDLSGWHLVSAELWKPGVYRVMLTMHTGCGATAKFGFVRQAMATTAIELGLLSRPNGYTLP